MLRSCRRTAHLAVTASRARRSFAASTATRLPRQVSSVLIPAGGSSPPPGEGDGNEEPAALFNKRFRQARAGRASRGGPLGGPSGPGSPPSPPKQPPLPPSFADHYLTSPTADSENVSQQTRSLRNLLLASFAPAVQKGSVEPTLALVCPLEGGEHVIREALSKAAGLVGADIVRLQAIDCLGLRRFGGLGEAGACLSLSPNPVLLADPDTSSANEDGAMEDEDGDSDGEEADYEVVQEGQPIEIHVPFSPFGANGSSSGQRGVGGPFGFIGGPAGSREAQQGKADESSRVEKLFQDIVNVESKAPSHNRPSSSQRRRIIYVQDATAMASTFDQWFPALKEAVKARRTQSDPDVADPRLNPTTIVLGCNPSLLHVAPNMRKEAANAAAAAAAAQSGGESPVGTVGIGISASPAVMRLLSGSGGLFGNVGSSGSRRDQDDELWMSSDEDDVTGRRVRLGKRLKSISSQTETGLRSLLPTFDSSSPRGKAASGMPQGLKALMSSLGAIEVRRPGSTEHGDSKTDSTVWKVMSILPEKRVIRNEANERMTRRLEINTLLLRKALGHHCAVLTDNMPGEELNEDENQSGVDISDISQEILSLRESFATSIWSWSAMQHFATVVLGHVLGQNPSDISATPVITWKAIAEASLFDERCEEEQSAWIRENHSKGVKLGEAEARTMAHDDDVVDSPRTDPVVDALKRDRSLSQHERRLLGCIVDPNKLSSTTFDDVLLPDKTIDAVRTVVSLPLLYPEAFHSGILAQHSTSGCLLFGPPGTGKTLLVRALARESGARMLAVQPSDVTDMYVGEGEKLVKAVFSLARRISPCIIFLDEVDSLFGARSGRASGGGAQAHRQVLTEFMQEMDGLSSASANREKQIIVMGATNRPYDLDEAVLRRLPRRLLVDLPGEQERLAILKIHLRNETLADDVDLAKIAKQTDTYSGSDLKHLCVSAALAAVKETVQIPWKNVKAKVETSAAASNPSRRAPDPNLNELEEGRRSQDQLLKKRLKPVTSAVEAKMGLSPSPQCPSTSADAEEIDEESSSLSHDVLAQDVQDLQAAQTEVLNSVSLECLPSASEVTTGAAHGVTESPEEVDSWREAPPLPPRRILRAVHFETAMKEITPSSSEEGNLPELRKWAEQYGEGGTKRGKKAGYGSRFGFGDEKDQKRDPGYGRVRPEDDDTTQA